ncbi:MAG: sensor histidine kinase [Nonomuraea sp.]|nr:sensor histidine kinase [Nonomuraea sp.]NUP68949.1 sensor histidine kinase [Nonomuraea sp.]NUP80008.1 sensor histidine kinase [Nonomuraea sp.]NUS07179.1 sensor histidine kinase [Nonomuraea sp.]NUT40651.1 sensor histidine kinase [Thermoactinospora sp.]
MRSKLGFDPYLALIVAAVQFVTAQGASWGQQGFRAPLDPYAYALLLVGPLAIAFRTRFPLLSVAVALAATDLFLVGGYAYGPAFFSPGVLLFLLVTRGKRLIAWVMAGMALLSFLSYAWWSGNRDLFHSVWILTFIMLFMVVAELVRIVKERRAERERTAEEEARRQASEERLTMAQELHDVLAHNISLIHVQASTALHLIDVNPEQARTALATIKTASKEVLGEMRSVLNVLRDGAPRSPTAGLDRLDDLVQRSGLEVSLKRVGSRPLPSQVERAAYRIVQESLTNAARHAPGSQVSVRLEYGADELVIVVADTGATKPAVLSEDGSGNGIPGMRERASALGGTLVAGPSGTGFQVEARLPLPEETSS